MENHIKKVLFIGSRDTDLVKSLQNILQGRNDVAIDVMDRAALNRAEDDAKIKIIKWQEKEKMSNFIRNPINIRAAIEKGSKLYEAIKEAKAIEEFTRIMELNKGQDLVNMSTIQVEDIQKKSRESWDGWFVLKDVVGATNMNYKQAQEVLDVLYAFGFLAFREVENVKYCTILLDADMQIQYINMLIKEKETDISELRSALKGIEANKKAEQKAQMKLVKEPTTEKPVKGSRGKKTEIL